VVVSNLAANSNNGFQVSIQGTAASFTTGPAASTLNSATLRLGGQSFGDFTVTYHVFLLTDSGGEPGSQLHSLGSVTDTSGNVFNYTLRTFTAPESSSLSANTTYWVAALTESGDQGVWGGTTSDSETGESGWSIGDTSRFLGNPSAIGAVPQFSIDATPVPEPGPTALLAGLGLGGVALFRHSSRRRHRTAPTLGGVPGH
jgi:hypothetical protein